VIPVSRIKDIDIPISKQSQDIRYIQPYRTCLIKISYLSISLQWLNVTTATLTHNGGGGGTITESMNPENATIPNKKTKAAAKATTKKKVSTMVTNQRTISDNHANLYIHSNSLAFTHDHANPYIHSNSLASMHGPQKQAMQKSHNIHSSVRKFEGVRIFNSYVDRSIDHHVMLR